jgi:hypothetical protein
MRALSISISIRKRMLELYQWGRSTREIAQFAGFCVAARRVVAKVEHLEKGSNPRFVVTFLRPAAWAARALYENLYCARGEMENCLKEQLGPLTPSRSVRATPKPDTLVTLPHPQALRREPRGKPPAEDQKAQPLYGRSESR